MKKITLGRLRNLFLKKSVEPPKEFTPEDLEYLRNDAMEALRVWGEQHADEFTDFDDEMDHFAQPSIPSLMVIPPFETKTEDDEKWRGIPGFPDYIINERGIVRGIKSLMDMPLWVRLWRDDNHEEYHTTEYLLGITYHEKQPDVEEELFTEALNAIKTCKISELQKRNDPICKHCYQKINGATHTEGAYRGKMRCDPQDTMLKYGYVAEAVGTECKNPCLGAN